MEWLVQLSAGTAVITIQKKKKKVAECQGLAPLLDFKANCLGSL